MELSPQLFWTVIVATFGFLALIGTFVVTLVISVSRLKRHQDFTSGILNTTDALIVVLDSKGRVVHFNSACEKLFDYQSNEVLGGKLMQLPIFRKRAASDKANFQTKFPGTSFERRCLARDGTEYDIAWTSAGLNGTTGKKQAIFTGIDVTERKKMEAEIKKSRQQLRRLSAHLQSAREEERRHIARELHDELGQVLSILQMDLSWLENHSPAEKELWSEKIESMSKLLEDTTETIQEISRELRPSLLDNLGLPAAIEWHVKEFEKRTGIQCKINQISEAIAPNPAVSTTMFRVLQEALTNVVRHSEATSVELNLVEKTGSLILSVKDNGIGITKTQLSKPNSMGLIGMQERVDFMQGHFKIHGTSKKGTTLTVSIPLKAKGNSGPSTN